MTVPICVHIYICNALLKKDTGQSFSASLKQMKPIWIVKQKYLGLAEKIPKREKFNSSLKFALII